MAYVIFTANGDEVDRRELTSAVTIGRGQDADVPVRDILLSRKHCRIEPSGEHWVVTDLGSKNGTYLGYRQIARHQLNDGDELRIGRTRVTYKAGAYKPAPTGTKRRDVVRPVDPTEALAGTVAGFILVEPGEVERAAGAPVPQPRPPEPTAFASEDVYGMLNEIASSSWDSIMVQASRPVVMERPLPRPSGFRDVPAVPRRNRVAFSLQAPVADATEASSTLGISGSDVPPIPTRRRTARRWNIPAKARRQIAFGGIAVVATTLLVGAWVAAVNRGPRVSAAGTGVKVGASYRTASPDVADITFPPPPLSGPPLTVKPTTTDLPAPASEQAAAAPVPIGRSMPPDAALTAVARVAALRLLVVR